MAKVNVVIPGTEKVEELIKKHYKLLEELEGNLAQICNERLELEVKLNQPIETASEKAERISFNLSKGRMSMNEARAEYGLNPIDGGNVLTVLMSEMVDIKDKKPNTYQIISNFLKRERGEAEKALKSEQKQVCIKADSYIAKEIKYQTALLHELLDEVRNIKN